MQLYQQNFIDLALKHQALQFGEFKLKSGRMSPYFFNMGMLNAGQCLKTLGECYATAILQSAISFDVIFGPAYKGIPLACATSIGLYAQHQQDYPYAFNRKEAKDHGEGGSIVGASLNQRVLIIDDVITAGTAIKEALQFIISAQGKVAGIVIALDRQEKGTQNLSAIEELSRELQCPIHSIITFNDVLEYIQNDPNLIKYEQSMKVYRQQFGTF